MSLLELTDGVYELDSQFVGMVREDVDALVASAFPVKPPRAWFDDPELERPTPLTIESTGRVFGHVATWKQSHIGMAGSVRAPKSKSGYAFFCTGSLECDDGSHVDVGQVTLTGGHAPLEASVSEVVAHYDNTSSAVMDVSAGEDRHGIWLAGALRPDVDELKLRSMRASSVSGDWRPISGSLELVAVCAVNTPGFPIPRARVAAGQPVALVAAGTEELAYIALLDRTGVDVSQAITAAVGTIDERLKRVETHMLGPTTSIPRRRLARAEMSLVEPETIRATGMANELTAIRAAISQAKTLRLRRAEVAELLRHQVHGDAGTLGTSADLDELRRRVHVMLEEAPDAPLPVEEAPALRSEADAVESALGEREGEREGVEDDDPASTTQDLIVAGLRARVKGEEVVVATTAAAWNAERRKKAAKKGHAMKDGSFPISTKEDWFNARQALGRAKNRAAAVRHIRRRGRALGIPKKDLESVTAAVSAATRS